MSIRHREFSREKSPWSHWRERFSCDWPLGAPLVWLLRRHSVRSTGWAPWWGRRSVWDIVLIICSSERSKTLASEGNCWCKIASVLSAPGVWWTDLKAQVLGDSECRTLASTSPEELARAQIAAPALVSHPLAAGRGPALCIFIKFPGDSVLADLRTTHRELLPQGDFRGEKEAAEWTGHRARWRKISLINSSGERQTSSLLLHLFRQ